MCMGSPQPPKVVQQGPTRQEMKQQTAELKEVKQDMNAQQQDFQAQLQVQIDAAAEAAAAAAAEAQRITEQQQANAAAASQTYMTDVSQQANSGAALTTATAPTAPAPRRASLTINGQSRAGAGLNIGA